MIVSGVSGNATFDQQKRFPFMFNGHSLKLDYTKTFYELKLQQTSGGTISGSPVSGESGTKFNLSATPLTNHWHLDSYGVSGATMTGSSGTYTSADVSAKPSWYEDPKYTLTVQQTAGGTLAGAPSSGYSGDKFGLTATPNYRYKLNSYSVTGATLTGNSGAFKNSNVTVKANFIYSPTVRNVATFKTVNYDTPRLSVCRSAIPARAYMHLAWDDISQGLMTSGDYVTGGFDMTYWSMYQWNVWPVMGSNTASVSTPSAASGKYDTISWLDYSSAVSAVFENSAYFMNPIIDRGNGYSSVDNGFSFKNDGFISAFRGDIPIWCGGSQWHWRVIRNGVTSNWTPVSAAGATTFTFYRGNVSGNEPFILQVSGWGLKGNYVGGYTAEIPGTLIPAPSWSGHMCYLE